MKAKQIPEFPGYIAYSDGRILNIKTGHAMIGSISNAGYIKITMKNAHGEQKTPSVHRIIAALFCEQPEGDGPFEVNHINGDKTDNRASNLEWINHSDNLKHAYIAGLREDDVSPRAVIAISMDTGEVMEFPSIYKAARFLRISQGNICMACKGKRPYAGGYLWEYK